MVFRPDAAIPADTVPEGWYLGGLLVDPSVRRAGIGEALTQARMDWLSGRTEQAWYFANVAMPPRSPLHRHFGFEEVTRQFTFPA